MPLEVFDGLRKALLENRSALYLEFASDPFCGFNRPAAKVSQCLIGSWWVRCMRDGQPDTCDSITAFSVTKLHKDLKTFDVSSLAIHGSDDQIVLLDRSREVSAAQIEGRR